MQHLEHDKAEAMSRMNKKMTEVLKDALVEKGFSCILKLSIFLFQS